MLRKIIFSFSAVLLLCSCATLTHQSERHISLNSDVSVDCTFSDRIGKRNVSAPGIVYADAKDGPGNLVCEKNGYKMFNTTIETKVNNAVWGNIIAGGLIGYAIDASSGNNKQYPNEVYVFMEPEKFSSDEEKMKWLSAKQAKIEELEKKNKPKEEASSE